MKLYQFETHCHTAETSPCGILSAADAVSGIKAAGYTGTFITDHFYSRFFEKPDMEGLSWCEKVGRYLAGYRAAKKRGSQVGLKVFLGLEVQPEGSPYEFLIYGPDEAFLMEAGPFYKLPIKDITSLMHQNGYIVFQAHPFRFGLSPENPAYYDGIEIVNSQVRNKSRNQLSLQFASENDVMVIAGGDVHMSEDIGKSGIMLPGDVKDVSSFIAFYEKVRTPELIVTCEA
jgi:hypothetical protein